jgi:hypothetical protein
VLHLIARHLISAVVTRTDHGYATGDHKPLSRNPFGMADILFRDNDTSS